MQEVVEIVPAFIVELSPVVAVMLDDTEVRAIVVALEAGYAVSLITLVIVTDSPWLVSVTVPITVSVELSNVMVVKLIVLEDLEIREVVTDPGGTVLPGYTGVVEFVHVPEVGMPNELDGTAVPRIPEEINVVEDPVTRGVVTDPGISVLSEGTPVELAHEPELMLDELEIAVPEILDKLGMVESPVMEYVVVGLGGVVLSEDRTVVEFSMLSVVMADELDMPVPDNPEEIEFGFPEVTVGPDDAPNVTVEFTQVPEVVIPDELDMPVPDGHMIVVVPTYVVVVPTAPLDVVEFRVDNGTKELASDVKPVPIVATEVSVLDGLAVVEVFAPLVTLTEITGDPEGGMATVELRVGNGAEVPVPIVKLVFIVNGVVIDSDDLSIVVMFAPPIMLLELSTNSEEDITVVEFEGTGKGTTPGVEVVSAEEKLVVLRLVELVRKTLLETVPVTPEGRIVIEFEGSGNGTTPGVEVVDTEETPVAVEFAEVLYDVVAETTPELTVLIEDRVVLEFDGIGKGPNLVLVVISTEETVIVADVFRVVLNISELLVPNERIIVLEIDETGKGGIPGLDVGADGPVVGHSTVELDGMGKGAGLVSGLIVSITVEVDEKIEVIFLAVGIKVVPEATVVFGDKMLEPLETKVLEAVPVPLSVVGNGAVTEVV